MALVDMKDLLNHAYHNRYAVGAFEIVSLDFLKAVIKAAEDSRSPVILNVNDRKGKIKNLDLLMAGVERAARISTVPVAINFDHCATSDDIVNGIRLGCNGVMLDASDASFPVNVDRTKKAVMLSHSCGVPVEGSLGHVSSVAEDNAGENEEPVLTPIHEVAVYIDRTGVDFLAISIGTMHGRLPSKNRLDFNRLSKINVSAKIPLVIHGGTGLTDSQYHKLIDNGVAKINYFTALTEQAMNTIKDTLNDPQSDYLELFEQIRESIYNEVKRCMQVWRSTGRAAEVLIQCNLWHNVEKVVDCNAVNGDEKKIQRMVLLGKKDLSQIPGVMSTKVGKSTTEDGKHEYCLIIRLANQSVVSSLHENPVYTAFSNNVMKSTASQKLGTNYEMLSEVDLEPALLVEGYA